MTEGYASGSSDGITVTSNADSAETIASVLEAPDKVSEAASELGKRGGKASAEARKADSGRTEPDAGDRSVSEDAAEGLPAQDAEKPLGKPRDDPKARMLEATRKEAEAKREAKALKEENERLRREFESYRPTPPPQETAQPSKADAEPDPADFDDYNAYVKALARFEGKQEFTRLQSEARQEAEIHHMARSIAQKVEADVSSFQSKVQEALAANPDALSGIPDAMWDLLEPSWMLPPGTPRHQGNAIADEAMGLDHPLEVLSALAADNGKEFQRIATLSSPQAITRALARLDAKYDGSSEAATAVTSPKPRISMATPPVRTVTGSPSVAVGEPADEASYEEHRQFYNAREQKARAQR
jgi:hypothetical protein